MLPLELCVRVRSKAVAKKEVILLCAGRNRDLGISRQVDDLSRGRHLMREPLDGATGYCGSRVVGIESGRDGLLHLCGILHALPFVLSLHIG